MKFVSVLCLSLTAIAFSRCTVCSCKTVPCAAFNDTVFNQWFPYNSGDQIIFQNNSGSDTFSLYVDRSTAYEVQKGCFGAHGDCIAQCHIYSNELYSSYNKKLQVSTYSTLPKNISIDFYQFNCQATDIVDTGLVLMYPSFSSKYYPSLNIGVNTYNNVQLITKDTTGNDKMAGPYKIFIAKNAGIVAYESYPDLKLWTKQ